VSSAERTEVQLLLANSLEKAAAVTRRVSF